MQAELKIVGHERAYRLQKPGRCEWCRRRRVLYLVWIEHESSCAARAAATGNLRRIRVSGFTEAAICDECESALEVL